MCLPDITACDQITQTFPLDICTLQVIKYWRLILLLSDTLVTLYDDVWHCMMMCGTVWLCVTLYDDV